MHPLIRIGLMAHTLRLRIPVIRLSSGWLIEWFEQTMEWLCVRRAAVRQIDAELETATARLESVRPLVAACLRNDTPAHRRQVLAAIDAEITAAHATHAATEQTASGLVPECPPTLWKPKA
jgi:hypothetical protein